MNVRTGLDITSQIFQYICSHTPGAGYHMIIVKEEMCNVPKITDLVQSYVPQASLENNVGAELSYILPHESSDKFEALFTEIEENKTMLGVSSYGASVTTMEEVFLR